MFPDHDMDVATILAHLGEQPKNQGAVVPPIFQNSLFTFESTDDLLHALEQKPLGPPHHYSRLSNPTLSVIEQKIAALEGAEACKVTGCGMAAITAAVTHFLKAGCHVVCPDTAYGPVRKLLSEFMARFNVSVTYVSGMSTDEVVAACRPETTLIYLESPTSALFRMQDLPAITAYARANGINTVIDNTYATPLLLNPIKLGVDVVCHSATKYMSGHSDLTAGAIVGSEKLIYDITMNEVNMMGNILHPFSAWLLLRGIRTLAARLPLHAKTADEISNWLEGHPSVAKVHHISLDSYPQRDLYQKMFKGSGGLFSFEPVDQSREGVLAFCDALQVFQRGISWGGFESLVVPLKTSPADYETPRWVIRLFCGLEGVNELKADISQAFERAGVVQGTRSSQVTHA
jgi:cystathionine beta-lyase